MTTIDQIILTIAIIAILVTLLHIFFLWATRQPGDTGYELPPTDLDGRDAQGSAYGEKGSAYGVKGSSYGKKGGSHE
jgi:hypothetical protein